MRSDPNYLRKSLFFSAQCYVGEVIGYTNHANVFEGRGDLW